jgi:hypothetical protein
MRQVTTTNTKTRYKVTVTHIFLLLDVFKSSQIFTGSYNSIIWYHIKVLIFNQHLLFALQCNHLFCQVISHVADKQQPACIWLSVSVKVKFFAKTAPVPMYQTPICAGLAFIPHICAGLAFIPHVSWSMLPCFLFFASQVSCVSHKRFAYSRKWYAWVEWKGATLHLPASYIAFTFGYLLLTHRIFVPHCCLCIHVHGMVNHLTPNGHFSGRTAPLTYRCCIFYLFNKYTFRIF